MTIRIAINGFGRIGRNVVRALYESGRRAEITVVAINELADAAGIAHLLKYDTSHGRFAWDVRQEREQLFVGDDAIRLLHEPTIAALPWRELAVDVVLDCTGVYGSREHGEAHLQAGAKKVLFSHPGGNDLDATVVYGVNQDELRAEHRIVSNASCTTNCIIPIIKLLDDAYGIESGTVTTIHSAMHDQQVIDAYHPDLRRTRAASQSIIPVDTKLAAGITRIFPQFNDRFEAIAVRVPTINVTAIDLSVTVNSNMMGGGMSACLQGAASHTTKLIESFAHNLNRLEATLYNIDGRIERTQDNLAKLRLDHAEAQKIVAEPFPQQEELDTKEQRLKVVTDELNQAAIEAKKNAPKREKTCYFERAKMKRDAARLGKKPKTPKNQTKGRSKKQGIE